MRTTAESPTTGPACPVPGPDHRGQRPASRRQGCTSGSSQATPATERASVPGSLPPRRQPRPQAGHRAHAHHADAADPPRSPVRRGPPVL